jgi:hypothetical protein
MIVTYFTTSYPFFIIVKVFIFLQRTVFTQYTTEGLVQWFGCISFATQLVCKFELSDNPKENPHISPVTK